MHNLFEIQTIHTWQRIKIEKNVQLGGVVNELKNKIIPLS
jgi:hypothetical protein